MQDLPSYFSFRGRLSRLGFWQIYLQTSMAGALVSIAAMLAIELFGGLGGAVFALFLPLFFISIAASARRLHDRNRSGLWLIIYAVGPSAVLGATAAFQPTGPAVLLLLASQLAAVVITIWGLVDIGFLKGTAGPNRFGDAPPMRTSTALA